jgi:hypothetical protein
MTYAISDIRNLSKSKTTQVIAFFIGGPIFFFAVKKAVTEEYCWAITHAAER